MTDAEPVAYLHHYKQVPSGGRYEQADIGDSGPYPKDGYQWVSREPLYTTPTIPEGWMPIETAPQDGTPVDLWRDERLPNMVRVKLSPFNVFYGPVVSGYTCVRDATHWMPLPTPPAVKEPK